MKALPSTVTVLSLSFLLLAGCATADHHESAQSTETKSSTTLQTAEAFLGAVGMGDMDTLKNLMSDDFVWHNEGDTRLPWIGTWKGKDTVLNTFLPAFGAGLKTTGWTTDYQFSNGNQAVFMGTMSTDANTTGQGTGTFSWAVRVHVEDGKVKGWNWFEDSFAVSKAYHGE